MAITRVKLSGSTNGLGIGTLVTGAPTTIHTSTTAANTSDEVHIWFANMSSSTVTTTIYFGATGHPVPIEVPPGVGPYLAIPGFFLTGGLVVSARVETAANMLAYGFVNRLTTGA